MDRRELTYTQGSLQPPHERVAKAYRRGLHTHPQLPAPSERHRVVAPLLCRCPSCLRALLDAGHKVLHPAFALLHRRFAAIAPPAHRPHPCLATSLRPVAAREVSDERLPDLYRSADIFLLLARESAADGGAEGFGIVCLEAAACGIPVVAGRSGGLPDAVEDGVTGILVDPNDSAAAAEAIVALLKNPERARRMGEAGRKRVLDRFTRERVLGGGTARVSEGGRGR
jgi:glycosyltransferase involved in cell wall biosynthesis